MVVNLPFQQSSFLPKNFRCNPNPILTNQLHPPNSSRNLKHRQICSLTSSKKSNLEVSWIQTEGSSNDEFGGWFVRMKPEIEDHNDDKKFVLAGFGASMAVMIAAFACFSFSKKGFKFRFDAPLRSFHQLLIPSEYRKTPVKFKGSTALEVDHASNTELNEKSGIRSDLSKSEMESDLGGNKRIIVSLAADPIQQEALDVLKKLKIIENDASADELCTRREYARWFVKANSMLERNPKYKIAPMMLAAGSIATAFDDMSTNDPDFWCIQALGEAGIVLSKLSNADSHHLNVGSSDGRKRFDFYPESYISRLDLINWKVMVEYPFTSEAKEMLRMKVGLLDLSANSLDAPPQLLMDLMAGDKSILRRVFGNIRRLQPQNPVTKAQAAVALISGRMAELILSEISRREAENQVRLAEMEEIRSDLIKRGEIQSTWAEQLNKEQEREIAVQRDFQTALAELEKEKTARDEGLAEYMKEKAALDYQRQLLLILRKEVNDMYDRLSTEKANLSAEQQNLVKMSADLHDQQEAMVEAKSILEAEKEALRILRYWVEEEALKIREHGKILEQAAQRWKWNSNSGKLA